MPMMLISRAQYLTHHGADLGGADIQANDDIALF